MDISIVTACFNDGIYLEDAFESVQLKIFQKKIEHIIVNDGSDDSFTLKKLDELSNRGAIVIHQENKGLGAARNLGIRKSQGRYILPLDSDNKLNIKVFLEALEIMETNPDIDVVYTDAEHFGIVRGKWKVGEFTGAKLLDGNFIDACTLLRKSTLLKFGPYDSNMPHMGHEDWELWVNFYLNDCRFHYFPKVGFYYRVRENSMIKSIEKKSIGENVIYIYSKYPQLLGKLLPDFGNLKWKYSYLINYLSENKLKAIIKILFGKSIID